MILELRNICKTYNQGKLDVPVLNNVSLSVEEGEYLAIMGPSGSGKTTLMNIIGCLDTPTSGEYYLEGEELSEKSDKALSQVRLRSLGFVFQSFNLLSRQSALENVALPLLYAGVRKSERTEIARKALERVGLGDRLEFKPTQLSGGQCQRVAIARAIVNNPKVLLADEPTGALDTKSGEQIMKVFRKLNEEGVTVVMITHEQEIAAHARRILHIRDGQLVDAPAPIPQPAVPSQVYYGEKHFDDITSVRPKVVLPIEVSRPFEKKEEDDVLDIEAAAIQALEEDLWGDAAEYEEAPEEEGISIEDIPVFFDEEDDEPAAETAEEDTGEFILAEVESANEILPDEEPAFQPVVIPRAAVIPQPAPENEKPAVVQADPEPAPVIAAPAEMPEVSAPAVPATAVPVPAAAVSGPAAEETEEAAFDIEDIAVETEVFFDDELAALLDKGQSATFESGDRFLRKFGLDPREDRGEPPAMVTKASKTGDEQIAFDVWSAPAVPEPTGEEIVKEEAPAAEEAETQAERGQAPAEKVEGPAKPAKASKKAAAPKKPAAKKQTAPKKSAASRKPAAPETPAIPEGQFGAPKMTEVDLFAPKKSQPAKPAKPAKTAKAAASKTAKASESKAEKPAKSTKSAKASEKTGSPKLVEIKDLGLSAGESSARKEDDK